MNNTIDMVIVTITPDIASRMLQMNTKNRPLNIKRAMRLAESIKRGEWQLNGDTIRVSLSGIILDGQHRLKAIELSGKSVQTILIEGLPDDVFHTIDTNSSGRTSADVLAIKGEKNYISLAASTKLFYLWEKFNNPCHSNPLDIPTTQEIEKTIALNPGIKDAVDWCANAKWVKKYISQSTAGFAYYVFSIYNKDMADRFFEQLESGAGLEQGSPVLLLRDRMVLVGEDRKSKLTQYYKAALLFKAFRNFLSGTKLNSLRVRIEGDNVEKDIFNI